MSGGLQPKLKVPSVNFIDKTPTPTRLLKAVDEIGLFGEDEKISSAKSTSSNNPFDEHFRKALYKSEKTESKETIDDVLNTPQIIHDVQSAPPSAHVILPAPSSAPTKKKPLVTKKLQPIAPHIRNPGKLLPRETKGESAQLLLKIPSGDTIQLSQIPFFKQFPKDSEDSVDQAQKSKKRVLKEPKTDDLKERNRLAAFRCRRKKKNMTDSLKKHMILLTERNKVLSEENEKLKKEVEQLRHQLNVNNAPVIISLDQSYVNHQS